VTQKEQWEVCAHFRQQASDLSVHDLNGETCDPLSTTVAEAFEVNKMHDEAIES